MIFPEHYTQVLYVKQILNKYKIQYLPKFSSNNITNDIKLDQISL
jgi:hypothetical protein